MPAAGPVKESAATMAVNTNFSQQSPAAPVEGAYVQPSPGIAYSVVTPADPTGLAYQTYTPAGTGAGLTNLETVAFRDSGITAQNGSKASAPTAGATVVSLTPGTAGLWEITTTVAIAGTTTTATDSNNFALNVGTVATVSPLSYSVASTTGAGAVTYAPMVLSLTNSSAVNVTAIGSATANSVYSATLVARRVG